VQLSQHATKNLEETMNIQMITEKLNTFSDERDWNKYHSVKNLAMALSVEASELVEIYQWKTEHESNDLSDKASVSHATEEIADIFMYLNRLCTKLNIDLEQAVLAKIEKNALKYPAPSQK